MTGPFISRAIETRLAKEERWLGRPDHLVQPKDTPLCNVWLTLLKGSGINAERFGDSTGVVAELQGG